jgi:hypothetical protein
MAIDSAISVAAASDCVKLGQGQESVWGSGGRLRRNITKQLFAIIDCAVAISVKRLKT